jgi:hypothetical protein
MRKKKLLAQAVAHRYDSTMGHKPSLYYSYWPFEMKDDACVVSQTSLKKMKYSCPSAVPRIAVPKHFIKGAIMPTSLFQTWPRKAMYIV